MNDLPDQRPGDAEVPGDSPLCLPVGKAASDVVFLLDGETPKAAAANFAVGRVIPLGADQQMLGIHARRVIAGVAYNVAGRYRTLVQFVREAMCVGLSTVDREAAVAMGGVNVAKDPAARWAYVVRLPEVLDGIAWRAAWFVADRRCTRRSSAQKTRVVGSAVALGVVLSSAALNAAYSHTVILRHWVVV